MLHTVSITSQGQVTIPAKLRRKIGLSKLGKALVSVENGKIIIEPARDILELEGIFKTNIKISPREAHKQFEEHLASRNK